MTNNSLAANQRPHISLIDRRHSMSPSPRLSGLFVSHDAWKAEILAPS